MNGHGTGKLMERTCRSKVTDWVREANRSIEVKIANTLASHMSSYPTQHVLSDQAIPELLGPVENQFLTPVEVYITRT